MSTRRPAASSWPRRAIFSAGSVPAIHWPMPEPVAAASTTDGLSPDGTSVRKPALCSIATPRAHPGAICPRTAGPLVHPDVAIPDSCRASVVGGRATPGGRAQPLDTLGAGALEPEARDLAHFGSRVTASALPPRPHGRPRARRGGGLPPPGQRQRARTSFRRAGPVRSAGSPSVSVPVLSNTMVSTSARRSRPSGALISTPLPNSRLVAATCTAGTASASAQGQVMIRTAIAAVSAASQPWPAAIQPRKVARLRMCTAGA